MMKVFQVIEVTEDWVDDWTTNGYTATYEIPKGTYSTREKAEERLKQLTEKFWDSDYNECYRNFSIKEIELDVDVE